MAEAGTERIRAFLAAEMAPHVHAALVGLKGELAASGAAVRWVRDGGLHATLKFLGPVTAQQIDAIRRAVADSLGAFPSFDVRVGGLGVFPSLRRPRIIWVGIDGTGLVELASIIEAVVTPLGFRAEGHPYRAHITLGRLVNRRGWPSLEAALKARGHESFGESDVGEVIAYRSDLRRGGALYTKLWSVQLAQEQGGAVHGT